MKHNLGNLEETVLLLVMIIKDEAYGFSIVQEYKKHIGKSISISAIHSVLSRLEKKGFIKSAMGGATEERGGRRKRIFQVAQQGRKALANLKESRTRMWQLIPELN